MSGELEIDPELIAMAERQVMAHEQSLSAFLGRDLTLGDEEYLVQILGLFGKRVAETFEAKGWNDGFIEGSSRKDMTISEVEALARGEQ